jgi:osmotically-inducible protein OsmY
MEEQQQDEPKHYLVERVRKAIAEDPRTNEIDIHVKVAGRKVFISGNVGTQERLDAVTTVAGEVLPDHEVFNEVSVTEFPEAPEVEQLS